MQITVGPFSFEDEQEAAKALLGEICTVLNTQCINYCVVGGWVSLLRIVGNTWPYPGTFDVDILLDERTTHNQFDLMLSVLENKTYFLGAKNKFQIHKLLLVKHRPLAYHVDFLHRRYAPDQIEGKFLNWNKMMSIAAPGSDVMFNHNLIESFELSYSSQDIGLQNEKIKLASPIGILAMKGRSLHVAKREKDAYDIFLSLQYVKDNNQLPICNRLYIEENIFALSINLIEDFFSRQDYPNGSSNAFEIASASATEQKPFPLTENFIKAHVLDLISQIKTK